METDQEKIYYALSMWANHIETGKMTLSANDALHQNIRVKPLTENQMKFVIRLLELSRKALNGKITIVG